MFGCFGYRRCCRIARSFRIGYSGQICNTKITYQVRFIGQRRYYKYYEEQMLRYTLFTFLFKRRSAKYRLPTEIYSPLWRIRTLKADGLTTHRERSLSVHCLHSSVLFFLIFRHRCFLLFNFPYHTLPIRETEDTMPLKLFGQAFSINSFQCFFVTVHFMYLANRLTLTGKPASLSVSLLLLKCTVKYIANTAENSFRIDKVLIFS